MIKVTYDELMARRKRVSIDPAVTNRIDGFSKNLKSALKSSKRVVVFADYDCDGIFAALELKKLACVLGIPDVTVYITDRYVDGYGIKPNAPSLVSPGDTVIILDMGAQEYDKIREINDRTGHTAFVIDHHEMNDDMKLYPKTNILNFFDGALKDEEPEWCTTGLMYKIFNSITQDYVVSIKVHTTVSIYAMIGTVADMVKVNTGRDDNAEIVRNGLRLISFADSTNTDDTLAYFLDILEQTKVPHLSSKSIGWKVAPIINAMSRMLNNGGQQAYDTLSKPLNIHDINAMINNNNNRKDMMKNIFNSMHYKEYIARVQNSIRNGTATSPIAIYVAPDVPRGLLGLIASRMANALSMPSVCVTKLSDGEITGSARNVKGYPNALDKAISAAVDGVQVGGHADAFGVNADDDNSFRTFAVNLANAYRDVQHTIIEPEYLDTDGMSVEKLHSLEPYGPDFPAPVVCLQGPLTDFKVFKGKWLSAKVNGIKIFGETRDGLFEGMNVTVKGPLDINVYNSKKGVIESLQVTFDSIEV